MARMIRTIVDAEGNVLVDLSGFVEDECLGENRRLYQDLAQLGLAQIIETKSRKPDAPVVSVGCLRKTGSQASRPG
jgi:hypothetical protein